MSRILIVNGPNLNMLGKRELEIYGTETLDEMNKRLAEIAEELKLEVRFFQSNSEGDLINFIQNESPDAMGLIINPGALTHYSYALADAITAVDIETVEVHISNIYTREEFRHKSVISPVASGHLVGFGFYGYAMALSYFADMSKSD
ncbi:MAG: type II 3-dehydroquinate dehydratase [Candidatus Zixiibacteriota bacterium]|nr:MAG: type II 3-dehydroquinate dehydratase [candidate division Zixibacteria bacterium]